MTLDSRLSTCVAVLLLSIFTPWAIAAETPKSRVAIKSRSKIRQTSGEDAAATERWNQIKSRYQTDEEAAPKETPAVRRSRRSAPIRQFPADEPEELTDDGEWLEEEPVPVPRAVHRVHSSRPATPAEPLPISDIEDEPAWISGQTLPPQEDELPMIPELDDDELGDVDAPAYQVVQEPRDDVPSTETREPLSTIDRDYGDGPAKRGPRAPRKISEISPRYDLNVDQDIRQFAKEQARQYNVEFNKGLFPPREFPGFVYQWEPANLFHYPLYFEDPALERYGHTTGPVSQPLVSIARFGTQLVFLPYQMTIDPICTPKYTLGWYRPGDCAPKLKYQPPLNATAAAVQAGVVTGLFFAIP